MISPFFIIQLREECNWLKGIPVNIVHVLTKSESIYYALFQFHLFDIFTGILPWTSNIKPSTNSIQTAPSIIQIKTQCWGLRQINTNLRVRRRLCLPRCDGDQKDVCSTGVEARRQKVSTEYVGYVRHPMNRNRAISWPCELRPGRWAWSRSGLPLSPPQVPNPHDSDRPWELLRIAPAPVLLSSLPFLRQLRPA